MNDDDKKLVAEFGIGTLPEAVQEELLGQYFETLELRLGMILEDQLSDEQLAQFEQVHDAGDDDATLTWLKTAIPNYDQLVADETEAVKADIKRGMSK